MSTIAEQSTLCLPVLLPGNRSYESRGSRLLFLRRDAVLAHCRTIFAGSWRFEPHRNAIRIIRFGAAVANIYAPTRITVGAAGQAGITYEFLVNEFAIGTPEGWRIASIVPCRSNDMTTLCRDDRHQPQPLAN